MTSQYRGPQPDRRGGGQQRRQPSGGERRPGLPQGYLEGGYFDDKGNLRTVVVTTWASQIAEVLARARTRKGEGMAGSQLRNFFGSARLIEQRLRSETPFDAVRADIARLVPLAAVTVAMGNAPQVFLDLMERNIQIAQEHPRSFDAFIKHLEAIVCYLTYLKPTDSRDQRR